MRPQSATFTTALNDLNFRLRFRGERIYCANVGDSRMVMSVCGEAVTVTDDHKPSKREEKFRIIRAGGYVCNDRVMETLAVARSFGDFFFKVKYKYLMHRKPSTVLGTLI